MTTEPPDVGAGQFDADDPVAEDQGSVRIGRVPWELQEIAAVGILVALAVYAVSGLLAGFAESANNVGISATNSIGVFLGVATEWAGLLTVLILMAALGLAWWQAEGWSERLDEIENADAEVTEEEGDDTDAEAAEAVHHLARNRVITAWTGCALVVLFVAAVGSFVSVVLEQSPNLGPGGLTFSQSAFDWERFSLVGGEVLATLILAAIGLVAAARIRQRCNDVLALEPEVS